ncbi:MAG: ABC transporter ATP-binding protein [Candidatus Hodarchaeota archaeon]
MTKVELKNISKSFHGKRVLDNVSFTIESGEFISILGSANAGKSTLLGVIAGIIKPDNGNIYFDEEDVTEYAPQKRNIGVIFQNFALYPNMSVRKNIESPLQNMNFPENEIEKRVSEIASLLRINDLLNKYPNELSGGEAQRSALARALVKDAAVYLLDEPLTNLDYKLRESMKIELKEILQIKKTTILYATPSPEEALVLTDRMIFLDQGRVAQTGPVKECYKAPVSINAGLHYSSPPMNLFDAKVTSKGGKSFLAIEDKLELEATHLNLPPGEQEYAVGVYPHEILLTSEKKDMIKIPVNVELQEYAGSEMNVRLRWNQANLTMYVPYEKPLDEKITVHIDPKDLYIFSKKTGNLISGYRKEKKR